MAPVSAAAIVEHRGDTPLMTFTITCRGMAAAVCWLLGIGLAVAETLVPIHVTALAVCAIAAAVTLTIKGFLAAHAANWVAAYEIGKEVHRVRHIR